ncbi:MAG: MaoC/PaaZ C-terminal domain-containing protein [Acidimicrobiales bacterium]
MPLNSEHVGQSSAPIAVHVDRRWTMAFAAGLGDTDPVYLDSTRDDGLQVHPMFPVCVDWQSMTGGVPGLAELAPDEASRGVHVGHDLELHRRPPTDAEVTTWATLEGVERRKPGAYAVIRHEATGPSGEALWTSRMGVLLLGVEVDGHDRAARVDPGASDGMSPSEVEPTEIARIRIAPGAAHVYSECARIWNPIHTDTSAARDAGIDAPILHGTATLGLAVSRVVVAEAGGDATRVRRIAARFGAPVLAGDLLSVRITERRYSMIGFDVVNEEGTTVISSGLVDLRS